MDVRIMEEKVEERKAPVNKANLVKRTFAGLIDLIIAVILFVLLASLAFTIGKAASPDYQKNYDTFMNYYIESGLVVKDESNELMVQLKEIEEKDYLIKSKEYFENYCSSSNEGIHACSTYGKTIKEMIEADEQLMKYGKYDEENIYVISSEYVEDEQLVKQTKRYVYGMALNDLQQSKLFLEAYNYTTNVQNWSRIIAIVVTLCLVYLLPTMVTKKGQTIGKVIFKLSLTNQEGFKVKKSQVLVRFLAFAVINFFLGYLTMVLVPLVSFTCMIFTKRNSALHDYCAVTMVVDDKTSVIYKNRAEFEEAMDKEESRFAEIDKSREDYYSSLKK